ncbi:hypothetical protein F2P44_04045 [Massilia sp. CCM 8695]|uniref:HEAT repeat domain-containing protein n=1 Tax=Massilia frigida TaxID=2609281 RepID=A0ABX0MZN9_9BURK|nr:hypothetical protein [Massilia frigida]NHZ78459.1 hypothetical protein [Massilia frigida]
MKNRLLAALLLTTVSSVFSQTSSPQAVIAEKQLRSYASVKGTAGAQERLEQIDVNNLSATNTNVTTLRTALSGKTLAGEKVVLIRTLGRLYNPKNTSGMNNEILGDLKKLTTSNDQDIARAAVFSVSRLETNQDILDILARSRKNGILDKDAYSGELAHSLRFAEKSKQKEVIQILASEKSEYGVDVLAMNAVGHGYMEKISPEALVALRNFLAANEPNFPKPIGFFGFGDVIRYTNWLNAYALASEKIEPAKLYSATVLKMLNSSQTDPRKVVAFLGSDEGKKLMKSLGKNSELDKAVERAQTYIDSFPGNSILIGFGKNINDSIVGLK